MKVNYQTTLIVVAMVLGILAGYVCNSLISPEGLWCINTLMLLKLLDC